MRTYCQLATDTHPVLLHVVVGANGIRIYRVSFRDFRQTLSGKDPVINPGNLGLSRRFCLRWCADQRERQSEKWGTKSNPRISTALH